MEITTKNKRILLIENDGDLLYVMKEALAYEGFEVSGLIETNSICTEITRYEPDVVMLDFLLNGTNGGELCQQIKTNWSTQKVPVILMSAYPKVLKSFGDYGCDAFIEKPFDLDDIVGCIQNLTTNTASRNVC